MLFPQLLSPQLHAKYYCLMATPAPLGPAIAEAIYTDPKAAKAALQAHAGGHGYSITVQSSSDRRVFYICSKSGTYDAKGKDPATHPSKQRKNTSTELLQRHQRNMQSFEICLHLGIALPKFSMLFAKETQNPVKISRG
jgi:hypothetical protein